jgi:hypothetical protein
MLSSSFILAILALTIQQQQQSLSVVAFTSISIHPAPRTIESAPPPRRRQQWRQDSSPLLSTSKSASTGLYAHENFRSIPTEQEGIPIPFVDVQGQSFIECYADSIAVVDGVEYTIGVPCDYAVAICYFDANQQLVPIEMNEPLMDDIYTIAESIVEEEFGEELVLQRTPQTLTLVGELEDDEVEDFSMDDDDDDNDDDDDDDEQVEVLLSFEQDGTEYNLVRLLDPILLVGKVDEKEPQNRVLLTPEESDKVMPILEEMFLEFRADRDE